MQRPRVVVSPNIKKVSERVDSNGNIIDPRTKQVIKRVDEPEKKEESNAQ